MFKKRIKINYIFFLFTIQEIHMNLVVFLLAGYETTSTTLAYAFHVLATIPVEQEKLINEIDEQFPNESDVSIFFS
jgi:cytochrome P450 family 3 subfamily A